MRIDRRAFLTAGASISASGWTFGLGLTCGSILGASRTALAQTREPRQPDVIYVPTPQAVVDTMLRVAKVGANDVVYDLGCGDGRVVVTAAARHGARGVGIDIDPRRIAEANENVKKAGVGARVKIMEADLFQTDFSEATVVTLYLLPSLNLKLRPKLWAELKPGSRVVSHDFDMGDWPPEQTIAVEGRRVYFWTIPARKA